MTLTKRFEMISQWWQLAIAFLLFVGANMVILSQVARFEEMSGGIAMLEVPAMIQADIYGVASSYPEEARAFYLRVLQPLDIVFPLTAGLFFAILLAIVTVRLFPAGSRWRYLPLLGLGMTLFDWLENLSVFAVLNTLDSPIGFFGTLVPVMVILKTAVGFVAIGCSVVLLIRLGVSWLQSRKRGRVG